MRRRVRMWLTLGLMPLVLAAGCGSDDGARVRTLDEGGSGVASGASASGAGTGSAAASGPAATAACAPVGDAATASTTVATTLREWAVEPAQAQVPAGNISFALSNAGTENHELVIVRAENPAQLPVAEGQVNEEELPPGAFIGEVEAFPAGDQCQGTFALQPGKYVLFCNIVETEPDGTKESHYEEGMVTSFTVT